MFKAFFTITSTPNDVGPDGLSIFIIEKVIEDVCQV